jgi:predicted DNA-binding transcriptional regulator AlpA
VDILDTKQVAGLTGLPIGTLRYWRHTNQGPASFCLGKRVVYRRLEVERWVADQEKKTVRGGVA